MYRILVIDDEQSVRGVIKDIIQLYIPNAQVVGEANSVITGMKAIHDADPDIVLLDIHLDDGTGFDLLNKIEKIAFKVIFITAYEEFALRAFKFSAVDYILKPVDPEELLSAIQKAGEILQHEMDLRLGILKNNMAKESPCKKILLKTSDNIYLVKTEDILYMESDQGYTRIYLENMTMILVSRNLGEFEEMLHPAGFFRVHKSYLVNLDKISHFEKADGGFVIMSNGLRVPVASRKREKFLQVIENLT